MSFRSSIRLKGSAILLRAFVVAVSLFSFGLDQVKGQSTWRLKLADVEVVEQREASGDRPYFAVIQFRSRFNSRNSTEVKVLSYEPHDWVAKPEFRTGLSSRGDHIFNRQRAVLPFWSGDTEWQNLTPLPSPFVGGAIDLRRVTPEVLRMEVSGAVIIGLDNNNTPPHIVRGLLDSIGQVLDQALREKVERNAAIVASSATFRKDFEDELGKTAKGLITAPRILELLGQITLGSTFNPDQIIGIHAFLMPALDAFPEPIESTSRPPTINLPNVLTAGPVEYRIKTRALQPWSEILTFKGSGGEYRVSARLEPEPCRATIRDLSLSFLSGDDGLRSDSILELELNVAGRDPMIIPLGGGDGDRTNAMFTRTARLPSAINRSDLRQLGIRFSSRGGISQDNWTLSAMHVASGGETIVSSAGRPLMRFTGQQRRLVVETGCRSPSSGSGAASDPVVDILEVTLATGDDDLRGGNDNAFVFAILTDGRRIEVPFNGRQRIADRTSKTVSFSLPPGTRVSQVQSIGVRATLSGGIGGDNWNIDSVTSIAVSRDGRLALLSKTGRPLARLSRENRETIWRIGR